MTKNPVCPKTGAEMYRDVRPMTWRCGKEEIVFQLPGWYCNECDESIHTGKDMQISDYILNRLKARKEPHIKILQFLFSIFRFIFPGENLRSAKDIINKYMKLSQRKLTKAFSDEITSIGNLRGVSKKQMGAAFDMNLEIYKLFCSGNFMPTSFEMLSIKAFLTSNRRYSADLSENFFTLQKKRADLIKYHVEQAEMLLIEIERVFKDKILQSRTVPKYKGPIVVI